MRAGHDALLDELNKHERRLESHLEKASEFLRCFFVIMNELARKDSENCAALPRSSSFGRKESWVTFFYARAYASVKRDLIDWV